MNTEEFSNFRERFNRFENGFNELVKDQNKKNLKYENYAKQFAVMKDIEKSLIKLNIGGHKFSITKTLLLGKPSKFFNDLLSSNSINDEIFIDRPGKHFDYILSYLRGTDIIKTFLILDNHIVKSNLLEEAKFYGVRTK